MKTLVAIFVLAILPQVINGQEKSAQPTSHKERATEPSKPLPETPPQNVNVVNQQTPAIQENGSKERSKSYLSRLFSPENLPNIGLLLAGIVGIIVAIRTLNAIEKQTEATVVAAEAAKNSVIAASKSVLAVSAQTDALKDTGERQLRAYICVTGGLLKFVRPEIPEVQIHLKNCGQTPAYDVHGWIHMWIESYPLRVGLPVTPEGFKKSVEVLGPDATRIFVIAKEPPVPIASVPMLGTAEGTIFTYGEVRYTDAFGVERYTRYRMIHGGTEGTRPQKNTDGVTTGYLLKPDTEGNDAN